MTDSLPAASSEDSADWGELQERLALLRNSASRYTAGDVHVKRARALRGTQPGFDRDAWRQMAELGWLGTLIPERFGGVGLGCTEMAVICEALGRALLPEPVTAAAVLAGGVLLYGDNETLKAELAPALAAGTLIPALAWRESVHDTDMLAVETRAEQTPRGVKLYGSKCLIIGGAAADGLIVSAQSSGGIGLYWVPGAAAAPGLSYRELPDGRASAELVMSGVEVPAAHCVAGPGAASAALERAYDEALVMASAELLGLSTRALEITLEYLRTRVQFGKPIGSFQALQHRAADLYIQQRMCRHSLDEVLAALQRPDLAAEERGALASRIKARCSEASLRITRDAIQMHGAMGFADECDVGLYLKRALTLAAWLGGALLHRRRYARLALKETTA